MGESKAASAKTNTPLTHYFVMGRECRSSSSSEIDANTGWHSSKMMPPWKCGEGAYKEYYMDATLQEEGKNWKDFIPPQPPRDDPASESDERAPIGNCEPGPAPGAPFRANAGALRQGAVASTGSVSHEMHHYRFPVGPSRWTSMLEPQNLIEYDMSGALQTIFATNLLPGPFEVTGTPIVEVYLTTGSPYLDVDLFAYLVVCRPDGAVRYLTEGCLKATHRSEHREGGNVGERESLARPDGWVPYHSHTRAMRSFLFDDEPSLLRFALMPTSVMLQKGDRLGLCFTGCDLKHFLVEYTEHPFEIHTGGDFPSKLLLPDSPQQPQDRDQESHCEIYSKSDVNGARADIDTAVAVSVHVDVSLNSDTESDAESNVRSGVNDNV